MKRTGFTKLVAVGETARVWRETFFYRCTIKQRGVDRYKMYEGQTHGKPGQRKATGLRVRYCMRHVPKTAGLPDTAGTSRAGLPLAQQKLKRIIRQIGFFLGAREAETMKMRVMRRGAVLLAVLLLFAAPCFGASSTSYTITNLFTAQGASAVDATDYTCDSTSYSSFHSGGEPEVRSDNYTSTSYDLTGGGYHYTFHYEPDPPDSTGLYSSNTAAFDNEIWYGSTNPEMIIDASDPQADDITYQLEWSTDPDFGTSTIRTSSSSSKFSDLTTPVETDPYPSGDYIEYVADAADGFADNTTYWWRSRGWDPDADWWGSWGSVRSFTVEASSAPITTYSDGDSPPNETQVNVYREWSITTDDQFNRKCTLVDCETTGSGSVIITPTSGTGTLTTDVIDITEIASSGAWHRLVWNATPSGAADLRFQVYDADTGLLVPTEDIDPWDGATLESLYANEPNKGQQELESTGGYAYKPDDVTYPADDYFVGEDTDNSYYYKSLSELTLNGITRIYIVATFTEGSSVDLPDLGIQTESSPNAVELLYFQATGYDREVVLEWATASEIDNLGFNIYRSERIDGEYEQINSVIISGLDTSEIGGKYLFYDRDVENGVTYYYLLEDLEFDGDSQLHGPVDAMPEAALGESPEINEEDYISVGSSDDTIDTAGQSGGTGVGGQSGTEAGAGLDEDIEILEQGGSYMILRITPPALEVKQLMVGDQAYQLLSIAGYGHTANPGHPQLPVKGLVLNIPLCEEVQLSMLEQESEILSGYRPLPAPTGEVTGDAGDGAFPDGAGLAEYYREDEASYQSSSFEPAGQVELGGITLLGGRELLNLKINPLQYCGASGELAVTDYLLVRLDFVGLGVPGSGMADESIRTEAQARLAAAGGWKLRVVQEGIYRVRAEELEETGFSLPVEAAGLQLWREGREVALRVVGAEDGLFERGDWLEFYAEEAGSRYSREDVYWLVLGEYAGLRMREADHQAAAPQLPVEDSRFLTHTRAEQNRVYLATAGSTDESDRWVWTYAFGMPGWGLPAQVSLALSGVAAAGAEDALLEVGILGFSKDPQASPDHHVRVWLNGELVGETWFDGMGTEETMYLTVGQNLLTDGINTVKVEALGDTGVLYDIIYLNYVELSYWHRFEAQANELRFGLVEDGRYTIGGLSSDEVTLLDVTDPALPVRELGCTVQEQSAGSYSLSFSGFATRQYRLAAEDAKKSLSGLSRDIASWLHDPDQQADYVMISHAEFLPEVERLAEYRELSGLRVRVVDIEDVFDEWSFGDVDPGAVRDFLRYAYLAWQGPAPEYVLLVGDGSYDYRDYLGRGSRNFMPVHLFKSQYMETASDEWFVDVVGDDLMGEMKVGRLAVHSAEETGAIVDKIMDYESAPYSSDGWERQVLLAADNAAIVPDEVFEKTSEELGAMVEACGFVVRRVYLDWVPEEAARMQVRQALNDGALLANYSGHGARDIWAREQLLSLGVLDELTNQGRLPIMVAMNCLNGYFMDPYGDSLAEAALNRTGRGAVAYWSSTGLTTGAPQAAINKEFYHQIFVEGVRELGEAVGRAKRALSGTAGYEDVLRTWVLFGDPALRIRINEPPHAVVAESRIEAEKREAVVLDASPSYDRDGDKLSFDWEVVECPEKSGSGLSFVLNGTQSPYAVFEGLKKGRFVVRLTVSDGVWESDPVLVEIVVQGKKATKKDRKKQEKDDRKKKRVRK